MRRSGRGHERLASCFNGLSLLLVGRWATCSGLLGQIGCRGLDLLFITGICNRFLRRRFCGGNLSRFAAIGCTFGHKI